MTAQEDAARLFTEFLEFKAAKDAAAAADDDPDNERDIQLTAPSGQSITLPWRKARDYDIDGFLAGMGLKKKTQAPAAGTGKGKGAGDGSSSGQAGSTGTPASSPVADFFRGKKAPGTANTAAGGTA